MERVFDFIANSADGVFAVDCRQRIVLWNQGATAILGYHAGDVLGHDCYRIVRGVDEHGCGVCGPDCDVLQAAERHELPPTHDLQVRTKTNERVWINLSVVVVPATSHELAVVVHMFRDVTREHELLRVVRDFAGIVSGVANGRASALAAAPESHPGGNGEKLTPREREILAFLATGVSTDEIAERLCISSRTVRNHINNMLAKLGVHSRLEAVTYSIHNGLL